MSEKQKTLTIEDSEGNKIELTVKRANAVRGVERYQLMIDADKANETEQRAALKPLRLFSYPDCISGTVAQVGFKVWPLPFADFVELDEDQVNKWAEAVHDVNPHWRAKDEEPKAESEKKESS